MDVSGWVVAVVFGVVELVEDDGVVDVAAALAFTTCHVPPKLLTPSPLASAGVLSWVNR